MKTPASQKAPACHGKTLCTHAWRALIATPALIAITLASTLTLTRLPAATIIYTGGTIASSAVSSGDTISVNPGANAGTYSYAYTKPGDTAPTTATLATGTTKSTAQTAIALSAAAVSGAGVTITPAAPGIWAVLDGNFATPADRRQLLVITEPTNTSAGAYTVNLDKLIIQNAQATTSTSGGAVEFTGGTVNTPLFLINGDVVFRGNLAGGNGGAISTGSGAVEFAGNVVFDSNKAGWESSTGFTRSNAGGAIRFNATAASLTFDRDAIFIGNQAGGMGGAIQATGAAGGSNSIIFKGNAVFEYNITGGLSTASGHGGAIYAYTSTAIKFYGPTSFLKNYAVAGYGGAIYNRTDDIQFLDPTGGYSGNRVFSFIRNVATSSSAGQGGGAIHIDSSGTTGSVVFNASNAQAVFDGNATVAAGGAIRAAGGFVAKQTSLLFRGNQAGMDGGAIYASTGPLNLLSSSTYRIDIRSSATFASNIAGGNGGAIATGGNVDNSMYFSTEAPTSVIAFTGNAAVGLGGAIYTTSAATVLNLKAVNGDITFTGNHQNATVGGGISPTQILANSGNNNIGYMNYAAGTGVANDIYFAASGATINFDAAAGRTISLDGGLAGASSATTIKVTKTGAGSLIFGRQSATALGVNTNNLTTTTTVATGSLLLANGALYGSGNGTITTLSGATLGGYGTYNETTTIKGGANLIVGDLNSTTAQTLAFTKNLALGETGSANTLYLDLLGSTGAAGTYDQIVVNGNLAITGTQILDITGIGTGTYNIITSLNTIANAATYTLQSNGAALTSRYTITSPPALSADGYNIVLSSSMTNLNMTWTAASSNIWQDNIGANWTSPADATEHYFRNGDTVTFTAATATTIAISTAGVKAAAMNLDVAAGATYTFTGGTITTSNAPADTTLTATNAMLTKTGAGTLLFSNSANLFTGGIDLASGTIAFTRGSQLTTGTSSAITLTGDATLKALAGTSGTTTITSALALNTGKTATIDLSERALALTGSITGAGNITKTGANTLILSGNGSAFTGTTAITVGMLNLTSGATLGGTINLTDSSILAGTGTATGKVTAGPGTIIQPDAGGATTPQTLTLNNLSINSVTLALILRTGTNGNYRNSDSINATGNAPLITGTNTIDIGGAIQSGTYFLGQNLATLFTGYSGTTIVTVGGEIQIAGARKGASLAASGNDLLLVSIADLSRDMTWTGSLGSNWNPSDDNWTDGAATKRFGGGDRVTFDNTGAAHNTVFVSGNSQQTVSDMTVTGTTNYTFTGQGINADAANMVEGSALTPTGKLIKAGSGTLTLNNAANYFAGGIDISGGVIAFNSASQLATSSTASTHFTGQGGTLQTLADNITIANTLAIDTGATATLNTQTYTLALTGTLTGSGLLAKTGAGTLFFKSDGSVFTGTTTIRQSALQLDTTGTLAGTINIASSATLAGTGNAPGTVNARSGALVSIGAPGDTASGTLTIGMLTLASTATITTSNTAANTLAGSLAIGTTAGDTVTVTIATGAQLTLSTTTIGPGSITKTGTGTLIINGDSAIGNTGATNITEGTVALRNMTTPATFNKYFNLGGGWLDISTGTGAPNENTAIRWNALPGSLTNTSTNGGITGSNELLTYGVGTIGYQIAGGITLVANPGANATTTLTNQNSYTGITRIDSGTVSISDAANIGAASNTLVFNGGNLRVTGSTGSTGASSRKLELRADATIAVDGGVTFITGSSFQTSGAFALTKIGSGTLTLGSASSRTGMTNLQEGGLTISNNTALGSGILNITGANPTLYFGTTNLNIANPINLGLADTLSINTTNSGTLSGAISGPGSLTKVNSNVLTLTGQNTYAGATTIVTGTLRAGAVNTFSGNSVFVVNGAVNATSMSSNNYPGLDLNGFNQTATSLINHGNVLLRGAKLTLGGGYGTFTNAGIITLGDTPGAHPIINGNLIGISSGTNSGFPSSIVARIGLDNNGHVAAYDQLIVNGNITGQNTITLIMSGSSVIPSPPTSSIPVGQARPPTLVPSVQTIVSDINGAGIIIAAGTMAPNAYTTAGYPNRVVDANGNELIPVVDTTNNKATLGSTISPEVPATIAIDAAAYLAGKTSLDSLATRLSDLRLANTTFNHGTDLWLHGLQTYDKIHGTLYDRATANTTGAQVGIDYADHSNGSHFVFGIFGDYINTELKQPDIAKTKAEIYGYGLYANYQTGRFIVDAIFRASTDQYTISVPGSPDYELTGYTFAGSLQLSYNINLRHGWNLEPQLQATAQRARVNTGTDSIGRSFAPGNIDSLTGRAGLLLSRAFETQSGFALIPHLRASYYTEYSGDTTVVVGNTGYHNDLGENALQLDIGAVFRFSQNTDATLNLTYFKGQKIDSYSGNIGLRFRW